MKCVLIKHLLARVGEPEIDGEFSPHINVILGDNTNWKTLFLSRIRESVPRHCVGFLLCDGAGLFRSLNNEHYRGLAVFLDMPETCLSPNEVRALVTLIRERANEMQFFIATHSYILARELSLAAEYHGEDIAFFSLYVEDGAGRIERADRWGVLKHNPISDAYEAHHDWELELFAKAR